MKTKWGVLGSCGIARRRTIPEGIARADNAELAAVYDVAAETNRAVAAEFGATACASEAELLAGDCDIVYIATPANTHCDQVVRAAEAGKHVLCEKPLGMTVEEGERMIAACQAHGVKLGTGFMMRFHAQHQAALELIRAGRLGTPVLARAQLSCWYPPIPGAWRQDPVSGGGGSLMDMGGHCIDLLEMFFGPVKRVACMTGRLVQGYASEDTAVVILEFANGANGIVDNLFNVPDESSKNRLELYGSKGSILAEGTIGQGEIGVMTAVLKEENTDYDAQQARDASGGLIIAPAPVNMYRAEVEAFGQAVLDNADPPVGGDLGLWSQKVLAACYESADTGRTVTL
ncbi:MAG TPA: Gfo/Idh/MocA family oxidoreductase [Candidatus Hydrogenedentes bacterium]|nr:Gfo/Idh/MocA family oxidoreductase [Candidatus Hydrogenedentota bacterium]HPG65891.1 Gfo/Idh/MocA family oxidoreductase [Candidatus Hydrogenedentota bacterium]